MRAIIHTTFAGVLLALLAALPATAGPPLTITDSGYWITVVDDGVPTLVPVGPVIDLRSGSQPPADDGTGNDPDDPTDAPAPPPQGIGADVARWAAEVNRPDEAQRYALIFETVRDGTLAGDIPIVKVLDVLKRSADGMISDDWTAFRQSVGDYLTDRLTTGQMGTVKKAAGELELIRYGLGYSARDAENALTDADMVEVVAKVNSIVDSLGE